MSVVLDLKFDGTTGSTVFTDTSASAHTLISSGDAAINAAVGMDGAGALQLTAGYVETSGSTSDFVITGDFTVECWAAYATLGGGNHGTLASVGLYSDGILLREDCYVNGTAISSSLLSSNTVANTPFHIAIVRYSGIVTVFINGASKATASVAGTINASASQIMLGGSLHTGGSENWNGWIDDFSFDNAVAKYTADFTPVIPRPVIDASSLSQSGILPNQKIGGVIHAYSLAYTSTLPNQSIHTPATQHIAASSLISTSTLPNQSIHAPIAASKLACNVVLPLAQINLAQHIEASALSSTPILPKLPVIQKWFIDAKALASNNILQNTPVNYAHKIGSVSLQSDFVLPRINVIQAHAIPVTSLSFTPLLPAQGAIYLGLCYSPENQGVSTFSNFPFFGAATLNDKTLFINDTGLFEYGGMSDNGAPIQPSLKTGKMNGVMGKNGIVPSHHLKKIPDAKVWVSCQKAGGQLDLTVTADIAIYHYINAIPKDDYARYPVRIGRAIKYNFIQFDLIADGCSSLNIDSIDFDATEIQRSVR